MAKNIRSGKLKLHNAAFGAAAKECFAAGPKSPKAFGACMKKTVAAKKKQMLPQFADRIKAYERAQAAAQTRKDVKQSKRLSEQAGRAAAAAAAKKGGGKKKKKK
jgi:hypothetical protein